MITRLSIDTRQSRCAVDSRLKIVGTDQHLQAFYGEKTSLPGRFVAKQNRRGNQQMVCWKIQEITLVDGGYEGIILWLERVLP
jgi:hypothetical protein